MGSMVAENPSTSRSGSKAGRKRALEVDAPEFGDRADRLTRDLVSRMERDFGMLLEMGTQRRLPVEFATEPGDF
jgi:hypothetical protein